MDNALSRTPLTQWLRGLGEPLQSFGAAALVFLLCLAMLQWGVPALGIPAYILPTPSQVLSRALDPERRLAYHVGITALEGISGFVVGSLGGFLLAVLFVHARPLEAALYPWAVVSQTVPIVALAPLLVLWFGNGLLPRAAIAALFTFFPVLVNSTRGLRLDDQATLDLLHSYGANRRQLFWTLRVPQCLPFLFTGLKIGATLAIIGAIVGEFAGAAAGLGYLITVSTYYLETDLTFAAVSAASLLGIGLYVILLALERWLVFWQRPS
ncbi:MAG: ABC transporter permease [Chloroflexi bacterium]|nr:ABC transporter permease [Chloroflexota bacterium]